MYPEAFTKSEDTDVILLDFQDCEITSFLYKVPSLGYFVIATECGLIDTCTHTHLHSLALTAMSFEH
jgi:hypothetical protein